MNSIPGLLRLVIAAFLLFQTIPLNTLSGYSETTIQKKTVKVGAFNYYPGIFRDEDGTVKGFIVDMLNGIAEGENWRIEYIYGSWSEGLERIRSGKVDLLTSVAYTEERDNYMDYSENNILTVWGEIYIKPDSEIKSLLHLEGKNIGVMKDDFNGKAFIHLINSFNIDCHLKFYNNFEDIFESIKNESIDAGVVNNTFGTSKSNEYNLVSSEIIFEPFDLFFTTAQGENQDILTTIDDYLGRWKQDEQSVFYEALSNWSYKKVNIVPIIPSWVIYSILSLIVIISIALPLIFFLKRKVTHSIKSVKEVEERYNLAMKATNDGLFDWDLVNNTIYYSPGWKRMLGYEDNEIKNEFSEWERLTKPEDVERSWKALNEHIEGKRDRFEVEFQMKHKDGHWVDILSRANAIFDKNGKAVRLVGTHIDISDRIEYENSIVESERRLNTLMSNLPGMAYRCLNDKDWTMLFVSDGCLELTGYSKSEIIGNNKITYNELVHDDDKVIIWTQIQTALSSRSPFEIEYRLIAKDGTVKNVWERGVGVFEENSLLFIEGFVTDITVKVEAEKALIQSEMKLITAVDIAKLGYWEYDIENDEFLFNDQFYKVYRTTAEKVGGYKMTSKEYGDSFIHPDDRKLLSREIEKAIATDDPDFNETLEHKIIYSDGSEGFISVRYFVQMDEYGKPIRIFGVNQDITDRKLIEAELYERNEFIQTVLDNLPIGIALNKLDDGTATYFNKKFEEVYGWPSKDLKDVENFFKCVYPDEEYRNEIIRKVMTDIQSGDASRMHWEDIIVTTKLGEKRIINAQNIPLIKQNTMVSTVLDITDRKRAEQEITESDKKHRKMISNISDVIVVLNSEGIITFKSSNIKAIFGWEPDDLIGKHALVTVHPDDEERVRNELVKLSKDFDKKVTIEYNYKCKDGSFKPIELTAVNLLRDNVINGILANYRDISERRKAEKAVVESQRLGAIGEMSSAVAHDFNNSLQSIVGNLELAQLKKNIPDEVKKYLEVIQIAATDASTRVKLLQRFSGQTTSKSEYSFINLNNVVDDVIVQLRPLWKDNLEKRGKVLSIKTELAEVPNILGNEGELRSVFYNIIKNSIEAMPDGGIITITSGQKKEGVFVTVSDNGSGMNDETKARLFQPFFTTKGFEAGRGLGMSGAYGIVQEHGGKLGVKNTQLGVGTTIELIIPEAEETEMKSIESVPEAAKRNVNILWVDDDDMIREIGINMLNELGHKGNIAENGYEALELLQKNKYDIILTDIGMPGMSGWEIADKINEMYGNEIKVAFLSGWGAQIEKDELDKHNVHSILAKPFRLMQLKKFIEEII